MPLSKLDPNPARRRLFFDDLQESLEQTQEIVNSMQAQLRSFFGALPDPIFILDKEGRYLKVLGGNATDLYDNGDSLEGLFVTDVFPEDLAGICLEAITKSLQSDDLVTLEYYIESTKLPEDFLHQPEQKEWFEGRVYPLENFNGDPECVLWVAINITEKKRMENQLKLMAETDYLTGAYNRHYFFAHFVNWFREAVQMSKPLSFLMLDVDWFKHINDDFGHDAGDFALQTLVKRAKQVIGEEDLFARFGGEEFALAMPNAEMETAVQMAEKIRTTIENKQIDWQGNPIQMIISIGVSQYRESDRNMDELITRADVALLQAKQTGRNRVVAQESI